MLTINKTWTALPAGNIQSSQKQDSPKLQTLKQDTVSFSGRKYVSNAVMAAVKKAEQETGRSFFKKLRELCEWPGNDDLERKAEADAKILNIPGENEAMEDRKKKLRENALSLLDLIKNDPETDSLLAETAGDLKECFGKPNKIK